MVTPELAVLAKVIKELGGFRPEDREGRVMFQKRIYLAQACGLKLGYKFVWDLYGPYSRDLAEAGLFYKANLQDIDEVTAKLQLKKDAASALERTKTLMVPPSAFPEGLWLEFLSSLHFLTTSHKALKALSSEERSGLMEQLIGKKPHLAAARQVVETGWERLGDAVM